MITEKIGVSVREMRIYLRNELRRALEHEYH